jgi:hypothetical protein
MAPGTTVMQLRTSNARFSRFCVVMYSSACHRVTRLRRLPTLTFPATAPTLASAKWRTSLAIASGRTIVSASSVTTTSAWVWPMAQFRACPLPLFALVNTRTRGSVNVSATQRPVPSVDPSSTTTMSKFG